MLVNIKKHAPLIIVVCLAVFFRFFRFYDFQFWSIDDENFVQFIGRFFNTNHLSLVIPNTVLEISLGPFFLFLSVLIFGATHLNLYGVDAIASGVGVICAVLTYIVGKELGGKRIGFIAGVLYSASFMMSFFDRRWWVLSLDPLVALLSILSIYKISKHRYIYTLPLSICLSMAWHADPTIFAAVLFVFLAFLLGLIPRWNKAYLIGLGYLAFSFLPSIYFEFRHPGAISGPLIMLVSRVLSVGGGHALFRVNIASLLNAMTRGFFVTSTPIMDNYLIAYCQRCPPPVFWQITVPIVLILIILPLFGLFVGLFKKDHGFSLKILYLFLLAFIAGITIFSSYSEGYIHQHYFAIAWPVVFLLSAFTLNWIWTIKKIKLLALVFILSFLMSNFYTLYTSKMRYPLKDKIAVANYISQTVKKDDFGLKIIDDERMIEGIGGVLYLYGYYPKNESYYGATSWIYSSYSLFMVTPSENVSNLVFVSNASENNIEGKSKIIQNLRVTINQ